MGKITEIGSTTVHEGRVVSLYVKELLAPNGRPFSVEIVGHPGAAAVVPLHDDGTVTLVHQYRHATGEEMFEIPAGLLEAGENPADCARRELEEETGLATSHLMPLLSYYTTPGCSNEMVHLFLATGLCEGEPNPEDLEHIEVVDVPLEEALRMIQTGELTDGKSILGLMLAAGRVVRIG